jgi:hypothetical protein
MTWLRLLAVLAYLAGFLFAWQCWTTAREPATAVSWLGAASAAFWIGRIASRIGRRDDLPRK